jgi:PEP-CTERM motif
VNLQPKIGRSIPSALAVMFLALVSTVPGSAAAVSDPSNDFLPTFTGPHAGDLDAVAANVTFNGTNFEFTATVNGVLALTPGTVYVFGINRGKGTAQFGNIGQGGVLFDSTFMIDQDALGVVNDLVNNTSTPIDNVKLIGFWLSGVVPVSALPSEGFSPDEYTFTFWPAYGAPNAGNTHISDFTPNNSNAPVSTAAPEPATMSLVGVSALGAAVLHRRRKRA